MNYGANQPGGGLVGGVNSGQVDSHCAIVSGAGSVAAGDTSLGTITLPAGGPWVITGVFGMIAAATATPAECFGGHVRLVSLDGDVDPNPAPSRFPTGFGGSFLGATHPVSHNRLQVFDCEYTAPGKARIEIIYNEASAVTVATQVVAGIMFGKMRPEKRPIKFIDRVRAAVTSAADTSVGTITLSEKATKITFVGGVLVQDGVLTTAEELLGFFRLSSDDVNMAPSQWPFQAAYSAGLGALIGNNEVVQPCLIPVSIAVPGGARIDAFVDLNTAVTNAAEVEVFICYE